MIKVYTFLIGLVLSFNAYSLSITEEKGHLIEDEKNTITTFKETVGSVVNISNLQYMPQSFWDMTPQKIPAGAGTGFVWDKKGHIVTNAHVLENGDAFYITFHKDPKKYKAKVVGIEKKKDIAVLKLTEMPKVLIPIKMGVSKNLMVGQKAMAIGNPFGLDHTITSGIISALGRSIEGYGGVKINGMIQTDTSINPGNSGGPLIDSSGKVIGVNTLIFSTSGTSAGIGFSVPIDTVNRIVPQLIKYGKILRAGLGITFLPDHLVDRFSRKGMAVGHVSEGSAAEKVGIIGMKQDRYGRVFLGDIILKINDKKVRSFDDVYQIIDKKKVGDKVDVTYLRDDKIVTVKIKLQKLREIKSTRGSKRSRKLPRFPN
jgi:S1-C subfamily serine protease